LPSGNAPWPRAHPVAQSKVVAAEINSEYETYGALIKTLGIKVE
jgi:hypothetical protein